MNDFLLAIIMQMYNGQNGLLGYWKNMDIQQ